MAVDASAQNSPGAPPLAVWQIDVPGQLALRRSVHDIANSLAGIAQMVQVLEGHPSLSPTLLELLDLSKGSVLSAQTQLAELKQLYGSWSTSGDGVAQAPWIDRIVAALVATNPAPELRLEQPIRIDPGPEGAALILDFLQSFSTTSDPKHPLWWSIEEGFCDELQVVLGWSPHTPGESPELEPRLLARCEAEGGTLSRCRQVAEERAVLSLPSRNRMDSGRSK